MNNATVKRLSARSIPLFASARTLVGGDAEATLLLSGIAFLSSSVEGGWVRASASEIEEITALSRRQQERARRVLVAHGLLLERLGGMPRSLLFLPLVCFDESASPASTRRESSEPPPAPPASTDRESLLPSSVASASTERENMLPPKGEERAPSSTFLEVVDPTEKKKNQKTPTRRREEAPLLLPPPSPEEILSGSLDRLSPQEVAEREDLSSVALSWWASAWGKRERSLVFTAPRRKAWRHAFLVERRVLSDFFAAIVGMTHDPWLGRDDHNDWPLLLRSFDKWADFGRRAGFRAALRPSALGFEVQEIEGVCVPAGYDWQQSDSFCLGRGDRFDPRTREWVRRDDERYPLLGVVSKGGGR